MIHIPAQKKAAGTHYNLEQVLISENCKPLHAGEMTTGCRVHRCTGGNGDLAAMVRSPRQFVFQKWMQRKIDRCNGA
jgi:hypothetical protein